MEESKGEKRRGSVRWSSELDSESSALSNKVSFRVLDGAGKVKLSFQSDPFSKSAMSEPRLSLISEHLSIELDLEQRNAVVKGSVGLGGNLKITAAHDVNAQTGHMASYWNNNWCSLAISSPIPASALPSAAIKFPFGELQLDPDAATATGVLKANALSGLCSAHCSSSSSSAVQDLTLRYAFKDESLTFIPSLSLPSYAPSFAFKRRFSPSHKLSYWYNFVANNWSAVYKQTYDQHLKFKAGYDSEVHIAWASLWLGNEYAKTKAAPFKIKLQFMLQIPQHDINSSTLMFRLKKRWDI